MSIEDKTKLINSIRTKLSDVLTVNDMQKMITVLSDEIENYDVKSLGNVQYSSDDMLNSFIGALSIEGKSKKTLKLYRHIITKMMKSVNSPTRSITIFAIRNFLNEEKNRGISDRTLENDRQVLHRYFNWLQKEGLTNANPVSNIGSIKYKKCVRDLFSDADLERLKNACHNIRHKAIIMFLSSTGCRIGEVIGLNRDDVNLETLECHVLGKGNKERIVYMDEVTVMFLKEYFAGRKDDEKALFVSQFKNRITDNGVRKVLKDLEKRSGVSNVHPHKFRRTLATNLIRHGMPIEKVAAILGHEKIDTTMQYVILDNSDVKHSYYKCA